MMMPHERKRELQAAYVLHQRPYRETSVIVDAFTPAAGRLGLVARGVKGKKGRWQGLLQPFRPLLISWSGKGGLANLLAVEPSGTSLMLQGDALLSGFYINELMQRLLQRYDAQVELFGAYDAVIRQLSEAGQNKSASMEIILRLFELRLLESLGYGLMLDHDVKSNLPISKDRLYYYQADIGPVERVIDNSQEPLIHGETLLALQYGELHGERCLREAKRLMRHVLAHYLGDKPLYSRELVKHSARLMHAL
jgi:DNA repair protein RecO (recombination protein O)